MARILARALARAGSNAPDGSIATIHCDGRDSRNSRDRPDRRGVRLDSERVQHVAATGRRDGNARRPAADHLAASFDASSVESDRQPWTYHGHSGSLISTDYFDIYTTLPSNSLLDRLPGFYEGCLREYVTRFRPPAAPRPASSRRTSFAISASGRTRRARSCRTRPSSS